jgi:hypothetical protein
MTVSDLLEQPCYKSDNIDKLVTSCLQLVPNLLTTWAKQCEQNLLTVCWQTCNNMRDFYVCSKSANKPSTSCVRTVCSKLSTSLEQLVRSCNKLVDIIRLVARLEYQQVRYNHDITILLQPCVVNLVSDLLEQPCYKLLTACSKLVATTGNKQCEHNL